MKFKTKSRVVKAIRITDKTVGTPGSWLVLDGDKQMIVNNEDFVTSFAPAGRGPSKAAYEAAKQELGMGEE